MRHPVCVCACVCVCVCVCERVSVCVRERDLAERGEALAHEARAPVGIARQRQPHLASQTGYEPKRERENRL